MLASIPSPSSNALPGLGVRYYGLMIALGVLAAVLLARKRWRDAGHDPDQVADIAVWAVPAGLIGTRVYHVITDWEKYKDQPLEALAIWNGGLGIPGGILFGVIAGVWACRHYNINVWEAIDKLVPGLPLAQAIGRFGNYFNQELYGRPTDVPWALEIDPIHRPADMPNQSTFHPTFAYEALWNVALCVLLCWADDRKVLRRGKILPLYLLGYFTGRLWVESLRIDPASQLFGMRVNTVISLTMIVVGLVWFAWGGPLRPAEERGWDLAPVVDPSDAPESAGVASSVASAASEVANDGVVESGPQLDRPGAEVDIAEGDDAQGEGGIDPHEGA